MDCLVVGIPKSGTNALVKAVRELGANPSEHMHTANYHLAETNKVAYIYRNPRNVLISALRYRNHQRRGWEDTITEEKLVDCFFDFFNASMPGVYRSYEKWMTSLAHIVRFEDLVSGAAMPALAAYLDRPCREFKMEGGTYTWTGRLSDWREHWTDGIDKVWHEEGMVETERGLGYENDS